MKYFSNDTKTYYIDKKDIIPFVDLSGKSQKSTKLNIILSPEFYWVRIFEIPVKYEYEANKLLPTLFEDILNDNSQTKELNYEYKAVKLDDERYICFAYVKSDILEAIKEAGISQSQIKNIHFAQTEITQNTKVNDNYSLVLIDENSPILSKLPNQFAPQEISVLEEYLEDLELSKHSISLDYFSDIIELKNAIALSVVLVLLSLVNFYKSYQNNDMIANLEAQKSELIKTYKLPATSFQTKAIVNKYKRISSYQTDLRTNIKQKLSTNNPSLVFSLKAQN